MKYTIDKADNQITVKLSGRLTFDEHAVCRELIDQLEAEKSPQQIIDLTALEFIDSAGLGILMRMRASAENTGSKISLRAPKDGQVRRVMDISKFDQLVPYVD